MRVTLSIISLTLASCGGVSKLPSFAPHKIEINQGNLIAPEMHAKLKLGMSRAQVRALFGTPLINDVFHANRWDYVYRLEQNGKLADQQRMTLYFTDEELKRVDDGDMPALSRADPSVPAEPATSIKEQP